MDRASTPTEKKSWIAKAFNTSVLEKSRMAWVDYLRGIAIILVVYRHTFIGIERSNIEVPAILENANLMFYSFRMPLFFILSGVFINASIGRKSFGKLVYSKFELLIYPYFIWATIQITLQLLMSNYTNATRTPYDYLKLFYQPQALDQFWYLPALFNCTIVYLILKAKLHVPAWMQVIIGIGLNMLGPHLKDISMIADWMDFYIYFALGDLCSTLFFKESSQRFFKSPFTLLAVTPIFIVTELWYLRDLPEHNFQYLAIAVIGCFCMIVLAFRLESFNILRWLRVVGFHSLFIYVIHVLVTSFTRTVLTRALGIHNPEILLVCGISAGVTIPIVFYNLLVKDGILWFLFTPKKPVKKVATPPPPSLVVSSDNA
jgi:fucose 4-O-acetylase-like acetyltransferase